jgi:hypothetical protein
MLRHFPGCLKTIHGMEWMNSMPNEWMHGLPGNATESGEASQGQEK